VNNIEQNETVSFKTSTLVKSRLEELAALDGVTGAGWLRGIINREYRKLFVPCGAEER
jgi:hypothetical protein